ncbi:MAG: putative CoA-binding protein [Flavobacteriales bacterium]|jgi:predicted CoA-binding protein
MAKTVVIGASPNPQRYSHNATLKLNAHGEEVFPIGIRAGVIGAQAIITDQPHISNVETVTLYVGPAHQAAWADYILELAPKRVIFNPGTHNPELIQQLEQAGIETEEACTLVLLATGTY